MENEIVNLVVKAGCEELVPFAGSISQSASKTALATSNLASMTLFIYVLLLVATTAAFGIMLISKLGLRDKVVQNAPRLISELFSCDFCLSWWTCLFLSVMAAFVSGMWWVIGVAVFATPIARRLIL